MTCGDKFNKNCPTKGSRIDPSEVAGRPLCPQPGCGKPLLGTGKCVDGHSQEVFVLQPQQETALLALRQQGLDGIADAAAAYWQVGQTYRLPASVPLVETLQRGLDRGNQEVEMLARVAALAARIAQVEQTIHEASLPPIPASVAEVRGKTLYYADERTGRPRRWGIVRGEAADQVRVYNPGNPKGYRSFTVASADLLTWLQQRKVALRSPAEEELAAKRRQFRRPRPRRSTP